MSVDCASMEIYAFDGLRWPCTGVPVGRATCFAGGMMMAVSGVAGIATAGVGKVGLTARIVAGVGPHLNGDCLLRRVQGRGTGVARARRYGEPPTSGWIVLSSGAGTKPVPDAEGTTGVFAIEAPMFHAVVDAKASHLGDAGLMEAADAERAACVMAHARASHVITRCSKPPVADGRRGPGTSIKSSTS